MKHPEKNSKRTASKPAPLKKLADPDQPAQPVVDETEMPIPDQFPDFPTSLNEELTKKIKDNPNKFIGCGG
jgi:hypothetical protein